MGSYLSVDTATVSDLVDPELLLHFLGVEEIHRYSYQIRCSCPIHRGDGEYNFSYDLRSNTWRCFSRHCGEDIGYRRDAVLLVQLALGIPRYEAIKVVRQLAGLDETSPLTKERIDAYRVRAMVRQHLMLQRRDTTVLDPIAANLDAMDVTAAIEYLCGRGYGNVAHDMVTYFGLGVATKGRLKGRLVIPIYNERGDLVGASGRSIDHREPKYMHLYNTRTGLTLYNIHTALPYIEATGRVYVVEGFFDVFRMVSWGFLNTVALMGTHLSYDQEKLLMSAREVVLILDGDDAGRKAGERIAQKLKPFMNQVFVVQLPDGVDVDNLRLEQFEHLLVGGF